MQSLIKRAKKRLNIEILSAHKIRHLFATQHAEQGTNIFVLKELLGHKSLLMTQWYVDTTTDDMINANEINNILKINKKQT